MAHAAAGFGRILCSLAVLLSAGLFALLDRAPAVAQQGDLDAIYKRLNELFAAGNYSAALVEAQKFEAGVKARFGSNNANYAVALSRLAGVYWKQGKYADAE